MEAPSLRDSILEKLDILLNSNELLKEAKIESLEKELVSKFVIPAFT